MKSPAIIAITGARTGIGAALATHLVQRGHVVYAVSRGVPRIPGAIAVPYTDLRNQHSLRRFATSLRQDHGQLHVLVNNAAVLGARARFATIASTVWRTTLDVNILGTVQVTRALLPLLCAGAPALILNIGSVLGRFPRAGWTPYAVSKAALEALTVCLAQELATAQVRVVALHPSRIGTALRRQAYPSDRARHSANVATLLRAAQWLVAHRALPVTGLALAADDVNDWAAEP